MEYDLQEAARLLGIDIKTLKRWIDRAQVEPCVDPADRRRKLITHDQLTFLVKAFRFNLALPERPVAGIVATEPGRSDVGADPEPDLVPLLERLEREIQELRARNGARDIGLAQRLQLMETQLQFLTSLVGRWLGLPLGATVGDIVDAAARGELGRLTVSRSANRPDERGEQAS